MNAYFNVYLNDDKLFAYNEIICSDKRHTNLSDNKKHSTVF